MLQDIGIIISGMEGNNHIISVFLSQNYPWDNKKTYYQLAFQKYFMDYPRKKTVTKNVTYDHIYI
jgi:hypothetical protein